MKLFSDNNELVGIDIGATAVRLVKLKKKTNSYGLISFGSAQLPENISQSDSKLDLEKIAKVIKELVKSTGVILVIATFAIELVFVNCFSITEKAFSFTVFRLAAFTSTRRGYTKVLPKHSRVFPFSASSYSLSLNSLPSVML